MGGMSDWMSAWPKGWANVMMIWHSSILGHQMPLLGVCLSSGVLGTSENLNTNDNPMWRRPDAVLLLATRCLYQGVHLSWVCLTVNVKVNLCLTVNVKLTWHSTALGHWMPLLGGHLTNMMTYNVEAFKCNLPPQLHSWKLNRKCM